MVVKKFHGATTREVLKLVRDELGPDALILSNRQLPDGNIEIMAVADTEVTALSTGIVPGRKPMQPKPPAHDAGRALQRTYALPPELDDDEEPTIESVRQPTPKPVEQRPATPAARREVVGDDEVVDTPAPFAPRYRYEPPEADQSTRHTAPQRIEPTLAASIEPALVSAGESVHRPAVPTLNSAAELPPAASQANLGIHGRKIDAMSHEVEDISQEIKLLRGLLEGQLAGLAWNELKRHDPERLEVLRRLLSVGFSPALSRQIVEHMPQGYSTERGMKWARTALQHNMPTVGPGADIVEAGGVYALVGPTGVGKTTTVAKLAARATMKHGASRVALITTDGYRIGAQDQLRIYGKILGIPVYAITDEHDLGQTLADLRNRHLVLIDTVGMSQRDQRVVEQIALLAGQTTPVKRLLLLSANAQGNTLDDVVRRYHGGGLAGCIFTKTDEAFSLGSGLDVIIRYKLPLYYITNGQRVPEDMHVASALYLVDRVFKTPPEAPAYRLKHEEYAIYMGAQSPTLDFSWREASA